MEGVGQSSGKLHPDHNRTLPYRFTNLKYIRSPNMNENTDPARFQIASKICRSASRSPLQALMMKFRSRYGCMLLCATFPPVAPVVACNSFTKHCVLEPDCGATPPFRV